MKTYEEWENLVENELNNNYESFKIGNLEYPAGSVLREIDPIAFREIVLDFMDQEEEEEEEEEEEGEEEGGENEN